MQYIYPTACRLPSLSLLSPNDTASFYARLAFFSQNLVRSVLVPFVLTMDEQKIIIDLEFHTQVSAS